MHSAPEKWFVVCVKNARGYCKGQPLPGSERTRKDATAKAAAMSDVYPDCFVAMPEDDFYESIDNESIFDKYLPTTTADKSPREN